MSCIGISRIFGKLSKGPKITMFRKWVFENEIELKVISVLDEVSLLFK